MITLSTDAAGGRAVSLFVDGQVQGQINFTGKLPARQRWPAVVKLEDSKCTIIFW